ncbi:hypothetical protein L6164_032112 [Bauhinia variegata]|uniref:Uncharacterized protein n=1 Tax=Bauhinia variegata TaxID=167791 RepID=A0ACB9KMT8_BAUVA|nr:hypothetical protein L6164_032112 [Bauhinia variegata]
MARRLSSKSSEDYARDGRDRYHHRGSRKRSFRYSCNKHRSRQSSDENEERGECCRRYHDRYKQSTIQEDLNADASKTGVVYIPPYKLARMMKEVEDKSSVDYQRLTWDALRKSINGLVNKVNASNLKNIIPELFSENLIRGRGLFCRSCMKSQMASPRFTDVFAALVVVVNTKFPEVGGLVLRRIVLQLKRAYKRNDKPQLLAAVKFIAHLSVGQYYHVKLLMLSLSGILHEGEIDKRVQFLIEGLFAIRKANFQGYPAVRPELDLMEEEDQLKHQVFLNEEIGSEISLDIFKPDPNYLENEKRYEELKKTILGEESEDEAHSDAHSDSDSDDEAEEQMKIKDETETNLINFRRTIYLTIMSSVDFEEAGHKLLKMKLEPGQEMELCIMLLECCSQERTYLRYYDALSWHALSYIRLTEEDTTSSSRIFIKILLQELSEHLGIRLLNERLNDPTMQESFESIFRKDNPKNTRFSINFFTSTGLGGLTENLREYLKNMPRLIMRRQNSDSSGSETASSESDSDEESDRDRRRKTRRR